MNWYKTAQNFGDSLGEDSDLLEETMNKMFGSPKESVPIPDKPSVPIPDKPSESLGKPPLIINPDEWEEIYKPIQNEIADSEVGWNNTFFETYGPEETFVKQINALGKNNVWTLLEDSEEEQMIIVPGMRSVNRLGYFITEVPWTDENLEVIELYEVSS